MQGKRGPEVHRAAWQNIARPTGFMFSMAKGKKSADTDMEALSDEHLMLVPIFCESPFRLKRFLDKFSFSKFGQNLTRDLCTGGKN
jgi:hypothetical protein